MGDRFATSSGWTVALILAGLFPILIGGGADSEVVQRIVDPMVCGMLSAPLFGVDGRDTRLVPAIAALPLCATGASTLGFINVTQQRRTPL